jgi:hypothetical protein
METESVESFAGEKTAAGISGILLGCLGIHKFTLGVTQPAIVSWR